MAVWFMFGKTYLALVVMEFHCMFILTIIGQRLISLSMRRFIMEMKPDVLYNW